MDKKAKMNRFVKEASDIRDLKSMSFIEASGLAFDTAKALGIVRSYEDVALKLNIGTETVHQYFTNPKYNCPAKRIPEMCRVLRNNIMIEWQLTQIGAHMFMVEPDASPASIIERMTTLRRELGDVLICDSKALSDGKYNGAEVHEIAREIRELMKAGETALRLLVEEVKISDGE